MKYLVFVAFIFFSVGIFFSILPQKTIRHSDEKTSSSAKPTPDWLGHIYDPENSGHELESKNVVVSQTSTWTKPIKQDVIKSDLHPYTLVGSDEVWNAHLTEKRKIIQSTLTSSQKEFLLNNGFRIDSLNTADVTNDGIPDNIISSYGVECGRCVLNYHTIFANNNIYNAITNEGAIIPRSDHNGFYLISNPEPPYMIINKYTWEKDSFVIEASKKVYLKNK